MENLIYIVLGIIFFVVQIYRESEKAKKQSRTSSQKPHFPEGQIHGESFPAKEKEKTERETLSKHKRSNETMLGRSKDVDERKDRHQYNSEYSEKAEKKPVVKKEGESVENSAAAGKIVSSKKKTRSDNDYAGMFETSQSVRSAFIASEIFNRKHF